MSDLQIIRRIAKRGRKYALSCVPLHSSIDVGHVVDLFQHMLDELERIPEPSGELIDQIEKVQQWNKGLNSDRGPLSLGEAMDKIHKLAVQTEDRLRMEAYRNRGMPVHKSLKEKRA